MGFLDKLKNIFDAGGLSVDVNVPQTFRWNDGVIPVEVRLGGHKSEARTINEIRIELRENDRDNNSSSQRDRAVIKMNFNEPLTLQPGEEVTRTYELQLSFADALEDSGMADKLPGWVSTAAEVLEAGRSIELGGDDYQIVVTPEVEGAKMRRGTSRRIRRLGMGEFQIGNVRF
jgi:sporulation-control protein spo0M